jgi:hypothetical protein
MQMLFPFFLSIFFSLSLFRPSRWTDNVKVNVDTISTTTVEVNPSLQPKTANHILLFCSYTTITEHALFCFLFGANRILRIKRTSILHSPPFFLSFLLLRFGIMSQQQQNPQPPLYTSKDLSAAAQAALAQRGNPSTLNLDDIFGDVVFTPDGDTMFKSEVQDGSMTASGEGSEVAPVASRPTSSGAYAPVSQGGGLYTTHLSDPSKMASAMGKAGDGVPTTAPVPFQKTPQAMHHLQFAAPSSGSSGNPKKRKAGDSSSSSRPGDRKMSEQQKVERRYVRLFIVAREETHSQRNRLVVLLNSHFLIYLPSFSPVNVIANMPNARAFVKSSCWNRCSNL